MPFRVGPTELIIVLVIVLIVFGVGRLTEVGGAMGNAIREFRKGQAGIEDTPDEAQAEVTTKEKTGSVS